MAPRKKPMSIEATECSSTIGAKLLGITQQYFNQLVRDGWIRAKASNRYRLMDVVQGYKAFLQDEGRRTSKSAEASRVQAARAREIELRNAKALREVIPIEDLCDFLTDTLGALRSELAGVPAAATRDLNLRAKFEEQQELAINRLRAKFEAGQAAVRDRRPLLGEDADDD